MKKAILFFVVVIMGLFVFQDGHSKQFTETEAQQLTADYRVHNQGNLALAISNSGWLGTSASGTQKPFLSCEFPKGSGIEYLYMSGFWVSAVVESETLTSTSMDGWEPIYEFSPKKPYPDPDYFIREIDSTADQEFIAVFTDTVTPTENDDPYDGRPHKPIGLEITLHTYSWVTPPYDDFVILDYKIKNISGKHISGAYLGMYMDADVYHKSKDPIQGCADDITGFLKDFNSEEVDIAWAADNDGDPSAGTFDYRSPTGVLGVKLLDFSNPLAKISFNWWKSSTEGFPEDWGPWEQASLNEWQTACPYGAPCSTFPGDGLGTPGGDKSKYFIMKNQEIDYNQTETYMDHTAEGWLVPPGDAYDISYGMDTRFLLSFGPIDIPIGDSVYATLAIVGGENFYTNPSNPSNRNFGDLVNNSNSALQAYLSWFTLPPLGPPKTFRLESSTDSTATLAWSSRKGNTNLKGYNIYRSTTPGIYNNPPINSTLIAVDSTSYTDCGLANGQIYYYTIVCVNKNGLEGKKSDEVRVMVGRPKPPTGLQAKAEKDRVTLTWDSHPETHVTSFKIYRGEFSGERTKIDSIGNLTSYVDTTVTNGVVYSYQITAIDTFGFESAPSESALAIPMAFDRGIVVVDETRAKSLYDYHYDDSVNTFYQRALSGYNWFYLDQSDIGIQHADSLTLKELAPYQVAIIHSEELLDNCPLGATKYYNNTYSVLDWYLKAGGKVIIEGRRNLTDENGECGYIGGSGTECLRDSSELQPFIRENLHINQVFIPLWDSRNEEFIGAFSQIPEYPELQTDSIRVEGSICPPFLYGIPLGGKLPLIGWFMPDDSAEVIYTFNSAYDTSQQEGKPVALRYLGDTYKLVYFDFPLYFIKEDQATQLLHQALADLNQYTGVEDDDQESNIPSEFALAQNYPNPFNAETAIEYSLVRNCQVKLVIYNILGQEVKTLVNEQQTVGRKKVIWDGKNQNGETVSSGIYFYRIQAEGFVQSKKMLLLK
ncbi:MAG TPA: T9SS type A sorting domain-containing protein [candidate division Zixibacteria bacterium]